MSLEVLPDLPEPDFSGLGLEKLVAEVPDEDVDRRRRAHRRAAAQGRAGRPAGAKPATSWSSISSARPATTEIPGSRGEGRQIELGGEGLLPGFTEQLSGAKAGDERQVNVTFPAEYGNPDLAGKEAVFEVKVKEVQQRLPAAIDDTLAEAVGLEKLDELRQEIRQRMQRDYDGIARQRLKRDLLDKLAERYDFAVPPGMVEMEFTSIWQQYQAEKQRREAATTAETQPAEAAAEAAIDGSAMIAPEETALEGASDRSPPSTIHHADHGHHHPGGQHRRGGHRRRECHRAGGNRPGGCFRYRASPERGG